MSATRIKLSAATVSHALRQLDQCYYPYQTVGMDNFEQHCASKPQKGLSRGYSDGSMRLLRASTPSCYHCTPSAAYIDKDTSFYLREPHLLSFVQINTLAPCSANGYRGQHTAPSLLPRCELVIGQCATGWNFESRLTSQQWFPFIMILASINMIT
jgi:hypothetical protein